MSKKEREKKRFVVFIKQRKIHSLVFTAQSLFSFCRLDYKTILFLAEQGLQQCHINPTILLLEIIAPG